MLEAEELAGMPEKPPRAALTEDAALTLAACSVAFAKSVARASRRLSAEDILERFANEVSDMAEMMEPGRPREVLTALAGKLVETEPPPRSRKK